MSITGRQADSSTLRLTTIPVRIRCGQKFRPKLEGRLTSKTVRKLCPYLCPSHVYKQSHSKPESP